VRCCWLLQVIFLYLMDNETSMVVLISAGELASTPVQLTSYTHAQADAAPIYVVYAHFQ